MTYDLNPSWQHTATSATCASRVWDAEAARSPGIWSCKVFDENEELIGDWVCRARNADRREEVAVVQWNEFAAARKRQFEKAEAFVKLRLPVEAFVKLPGID